MQIGPYQIQSELGRGGMGVVYLASSPELGQVALKVLLSEATPASHKRLQREAAALAQLEHPGIVKLHDFGEHQGRAYLTLAFVPGESLEARLLSSGALPIWEAVELARDVAEALHFAHQRGLLHRDVKPANVLLDRVSGRPVLTDFGLVKDLEASVSRTRLTADGRFLGTPGFWAPEQARGKLDALGPWTDVYGLGATLYTCLVGVPRSRVRP